ncbi:transcription termination factor Rho [bacterium]|nr:MAG: transcription termination factor Rho [bacterium]
MTPTALAKEAKAAKIDFKTLTRGEVIERLLPIVNKEKDPIYVKGILELLPDGYGFLRRDDYHQTQHDAYVSQSQVKKAGLRGGDVVFGPIRLPSDGEKYPGLLRVEAVNGFGAENPDFKRRRHFDEFTPDFPREKLTMETTAEGIPQRITDLIAPIGKGQRGLIVSPPKAGKTTIMKAIANAITANHPEVYLMVLLVDERPEEVTDMKRNTRGQVISSTFDEPAENHMRVAELCLEQAKRMVETGRDVVILLDSLTRLSRASNLTCANSGRTLSGGLDPAALYRPRRFFGAARKIDEGGSLTIVASVLVDTGSKMDEAIFEELKGTGNMELVLDRDLAERRIWPAVDVKKSGTRHEELLFGKDELEGVVQLHRLLANHQNSVEATESLIKLLKRTPTNAAFLDTVIARTTTKV